MSAPVSQEFAPRSASAWFADCAAALPASALQILREAHKNGGQQVDAADTWLALKEQKSESQTRAKARRAHVKGWGTGAALREDETEQEQIDQIDPITPPPGLGAWAFLQDPADCRAAMEIRDAIEECDALKALEALGLKGLAQDPEVLGRLRGEMQSWAALADLDEADTSAIALRDRVGLRMAQIALRAQRESIERGQGVLL
jgi:hypothetical protein